MTTKKYIQRVYINDSMASELLISGKQYKELFNNYTENIKENNKDTLYIENFGEMTTQTIKKDYENHTKTTTYFYNNNMSCVVLVKIECKKGFHF